MELDDLKTAWRDLERRLEESEANARALRRDIKMDRARSTLRRLSWGQALLAAIWIAVIVIVALFWIEHGATPHLLLAGASLYLYALIGILSCAVQILWIASIDYAAPVVTLQRKLAILRKVRIWNQILLCLPMWALWVVATMVGAKWLFDLDLYARARPGSTRAWRSALSGSPSRCGCLGGWAGRRAVRVGSSACSTIWPAAAWSG